MAETSADFDVLVLGAGQAASPQRLAWARQGYRTLLAEARDRVGGRA